MSDLTGDARFALRTLVRRPGATLLLVATLALGLLAAHLGLLVNQARFESIPLLGDWSPEARITLKFGLLTTLITPPCLTWALGRSGETA